MNDNSFTIFKLYFIKNKGVVHYPWEQPNVPFLVYHDENDKVVLVKVLCDFAKKKVYVKVPAVHNSFEIMPIQNFFCEMFNIPEKDIIGRYDECLYDLIDDLKRNLHNRQGQLVKFEIEPNQFGFSKINGAKRWEMIEF